FLWNYVWSGNTFHKRFLEVIGAVFHYEQPYHSEWTGERFDLFIIGGGK
ncbi:phage protein Gp13 family protein, partial [Kocuria sp. CPCC 205274]